MANSTSSASERPGGVPAVELRSITKRFPGVIANHDLDLVVRKGTIHAVVGENGAGKSTLMKTLYGMHRPDEGEILIDGQTRSFSSPAAAIAAGIGMVHQHFKLADNFTVTENIVLGAEPGTGWKVDFAAAAARIVELGEQYGLSIDPHALVDDLGVGDRQRVEILKVLYRGANVIILDEPTAVLVPSEVTELFTALRELTAQGLSVVFISHKLDEVLSVANDITVIRRGTSVAAVRPEDTTARELAELMVGSELPSPETATGESIRDQVVLAVHGLSVHVDERAVVDGFDAQIRAGEILGIAGVEGNGQAELIEALMGIRASTGSVEFMGSDVSRWSTRRRREAGMAYIPEDRGRQGLLLESPLWENRMLGQQTMAPNANGWRLNLTGAKADTQRIVAEYDVRTPSIDVLASALSGGNQQKLIVGREMSGEPKLLIAAHPTRGVDVGAQAIIWNLLRAARDEGLAVLLISADLDELIGLSDSLTVILRGRRVADVDPATVTPAELGSAMTGAKNEGTPAA